MQKRYSVFFAILTEIELLAGVLLVRSSLGGEELHGACVSHRKRWTSATLPTSRPVSHISENPNLDDINAYD